MKRFFFNNVMFLVGLKVLLINKFRYLYGYKKPRSFTSSEIEKSINYNFHVAENLISHLKKYNGESIKDKTILELGVGPDLGNSLIWLKKGIKKYVGFDIIPLYQGASKMYYEKIYTKLEVDTNFMKLANEKTEIIIDPTYSPEVNLKGINFDVIFSQATFEHFDNIERTLKDLSSISKTGTILISEIDFQTHTGIIKKIDPLNIYRYSPKLYSFFNFQGIPNRSRVYEYRNALKSFGWSNIVLYPKKILADDKFEFVKNSLSKKYKSDEVQKEMNIMSAVICATKN